MTDVKKDALFDDVPFNKRKEWWFIVGCYQIYRETSIPLCIKTRKNIFSHGLSKYNRFLAYTMSFNVSKVREWVLQYRNTYKKIE